MTRRNYLRWLASGFACLWLLLAISPLDRATWMLENVLLVGGVVTLWMTRRSLPLSTMAYSMVFALLCLHAVGAHFTYSLVPYDAAFHTFSGASFNDLFDLRRNHYDRLVHFAYGLLLALPFREMLMMHAGARGAWSYVLPFDLVMSSSLAYELIEWAAAVIWGGDLGAAFLGTQGDEWDAHRDMALAGLGALFALLGILLVNRRRGSDLSLDWLESLGQKRG